MSAAYWNLATGEYICMSNEEYFRRQEKTMDTGITTDVMPTPKKPSKQYGHPDFYKLLDGMAELHSRKNHDYAGESDPLKNLRSSDRLGLPPFTGVMVRLQDKWSRLESFMTQGELLVKDESVEDTLMDNAVYSLLAIILLREAKKADQMEDL